MLILKRNPYQRILLTGGITIEVVEVRGQTVKLGITAPPGVRVSREEIADRFPVDPQPPFPEK